MCPIACPTYSKVIPVSWVSEATCCLEHIAIEYSTVVASAARSCISQCNICYSCNRGWILTPATWIVQWMQILSSTVNNSTSSSSPASSWAQGCTRSMVSPCTILYSSRSLSPLISIRFCLCSIIIQLYYNNIIYKYVYTTHAMWKRGWKRVFGVLALTSRLQAVASSGRLSWWLCQCSLAKTAMGRGPSGVE